MPVRRTMRKVLLMAAVTLPLVAAGCSNSNSASTTTTSSGSGTSSPTGTPITIAYVTDLTGEGASQNGTSAAGFNARIQLQNAEGGVNGHKLVPLIIDDQTSPTLIATAVQSADSKAFRDRLPEPAVLPGRQVPAAGGRTGDRHL